MNDAKLVLAKKKELLEECRRRKKEREIQKNLESSGAYKTGSTTKHLHNGEENGKRNDLTKEFENLTADEILRKCGINDITSSSASSTLTPSSSTHSFSSSNHSIYAIYNSSANGTNGLSAGYVHASRQLRDIEVLKKQLENLNLKSELNSCHKVDIFPSELVKYDKEIQTRQSVLAHNNDEKKEGSNQNHAVLNSSISLEAGDAITDEEDFGPSDPHFKESRSTKNRIQQLPLAFYEEVLVHDTFQWEDEFGHHHHNDHHGENKGHQELTDNMLKKNDDSCNKHSINGEVNHDFDTIDDDDIVDAIHNNPKHHRSSSHLSLFLDTNDIYRFLSEKRPVVERALKQNENDIFVDYTASNDDEKIRLEEENRVAVKFKKRIPAPEKYNNSVVTSLDWSLQHPELILASYDNSPINYVDLDNEAAIALWNVRSDLKSPQQLFTSTSLITSSLFSPYQPNLIIAGTFSGQICMWDIRSNKRTPIQRTSLSSSSHVCPVYCVRVLDCASSGQNLVSISNDGKLCFWSLENLNSPMDTQDLIIKHATNRTVYATCMDFQNIANSNENDRRLAIVGTEDGLAHSFNIPKFGVEKTYEDHFGPLTSLNCHVSSTFQTSTQPNQDYSIQESSDQQSSYSFSNLFLTSSFDSSVKLWNMTESSKPLYTFDNTGADYVFDVAWSPIHPSLFASVDGAGRLEFWNLNKSIEMATISVNVDNRRALNKLKWSPRKGTEIIVGDDQGELSIYELSENFSSPSPDEFVKFEKTINSIQKLNQELQSLINSDTTLA